MNRRIEQRRTREGLLWLYELHNERVVRRTLMDPNTGEVLDQVWRDSRGQTRSWSTSCRRAAIPGLHEGSRTGTVGVERGAAPRGLPPLHGRVYDVAIERGIELQAAVG